MNRGYELEDFLLVKKENKMFQISWINVKSALVYGVLSALLLMCLYAIQVGDIFSLNLKELANAGVFGFLTTFTSLLKNLLTTSDGKFVGLIKVIPPTE